MTIVASAEALTDFLGSNISRSLRSARVRPGARYGFILLLTEQIEGADHNIHFAMGEHGPDMAPEILLKAYALAKKAKSSANDGGPK